MSYSSSLGADVLFQAATLAAPTVSTAPVTGSTAGYPLAERDEIVRAMTAAATLLNAKVARTASGGFLTSADGIRAADAKRLSDRVLWIKALRPAANGLISSPALLNLLQGMLAERATLGPLVDAQLTFASAVHKAGPALAARMKAMATPPPAPIQLSNKTVMTIGSQTGTSSKLSTADKLATVDTTGSGGKEVACVDGYFRDASGQCVAPAPAPVQPTEPAPAEVYEPPADALPGGLVPPTIEESFPVPAQSPAAGPFGVPWTYIGIGGAVVALAAGGYFLTRKSPTANRRRRARRNSRRRRASKRAGR
jgi:hypothetical protein